MADQGQLSFFGENRSLFSDSYLRERLSDLREWKENLSDPFQKAVEVYRDKRATMPELEAKIEKTDWLIDQVVYRLYGLSEEEIGVVEGSV